MTKVQELETRRDRIAGTVAELQQALDLLDGSEELVSVQKMTNDLDASTRLLAALDRQLSQAYAAQREQARADVERQRAQAAAAAAKIDADLQRLLWPVFETIERRVVVTEIDPPSAATSQRMRAAVLQMMRGVGIDMQVSATSFVAQPVRR